MTEAPSRRQTKNEIRDWLTAMSERAGTPLSRSRADKLAKRYKQGAALADVVEQVGTPAEPSTPTIEGAPVFKTRSVVFKPSRATTGRINAG